MHAIEAYIQTHPLIAWLVMAGAFVILAKCADIFVESAVSLANRINIPKLVIGIVLVSFATTAPELAVSLMSAIQGQPEMALGNAIGSVICDDGLALGLAGLCAAATIPVIPRVLRTSGVFLIIIEIVAFLFVFQDYTLTRLEGLSLVLLFFGYLLYMFHEHKKGKFKAELEADEPEEYKKMSWGKMMFFFLLGLGGIIFASEFIVVSATTIARSLSVPEAVIALTLVAFGTSIPEVATCVISARKGHGDIAIGNIIGADILNICWVAGASAMANDLVLNEKQIYFMFPAMFIIVFIMLIMLRWKYRLSKTKGAILLLCYAVYLVISIVLFPPKKEVKTEKPQEHAIANQTSS